MQKDQNEAMLIFLNQANVKELATLKLKCFLQFLLQNQLTVHLLGVKEYMRPTLQTLKGK